MRVLKILIIIVLTLITLAGGGLAMVIHNDTVIEWWIPTTICAVVAIPTGMLLRGTVHRLSPSTGPLINMLLAAAMSMALLEGAFYSLNYYLSDNADARHVQAEVMEKRTEEHYRVRRIGRNRVGRGERYHTYSVTVSIPGGRMKKITVPAGEYRQLRNGDKVDLLTETGLFGVPVIKTRTIIKPQTRQNIHRNLNQIKTK